MTALNARIMWEAVSRADIREVPGAKSNGRIVGWIRSLFPRFKGSDATAWCSAFIYKVTTAAGADVAGDVNLAARSWRKAGRQIWLDSAMQGDVVILSRPGGEDWQGHVGLYCRHTSTHVTLLAGNQRNRVCFQTFPLSRVVYCCRLQEAVCTSEPIASSVD